MSIWQRQESAGWTIGPLLMECVAVSAILVVFGCQPNDSPATDRASQARSAQASEPARTSDNSECLICHMDFDSEELSVKHDKAGIGCISCHGDSLAHGDDELNIAPPDKLFGRAEIEGFCKGCHATHVEGKVYDEFVKRWHS
ncbi:MAG: multiheme c-type cytochrome, partial [Planctomycetota bacterium]